MNTEAIKLRRDPKLFIKFMFGPNYTLTPQETNKAMELWRKHKKKIGAAKFLRRQKARTKGPTLRTRQETNRKNSAIRAQKERAIVHAFIERTGPRPFKWEKMQGAFGNLGFFTAMLIAGVQKRKKKK